MAFYNGREINIPDYNPFPISNQTLSFIYTIDGSNGTARVADITFTKDEKQKLKDSQGSQFDSLKEISDKDNKARQAEQKQVRTDLAKVNQ